MERKNNLHNVQNFYTKAVEQGVPERVVQGLPVSRRGRFLTGLEIAKIYTGDNNTTFRELGERFGISDKNARSRAVAALEQMHKKTPDASREGLDIGALHGMYHPEPKNPNLKNARPSRISREEAILIRLQLLSARTSEEIAEVFPRLTYDLCNRFSKEKNPRVISLSKVISNDYTARNHSGFHHALNEANIPVLAFEIRRKDGKSKHNRFILASDVRRARETFLNNPRFDAKRKIGIDLDEPIC